MWCNYNDYLFECIQIRSYTSSSQTAAYFAHERSSNAFQPSNVWQQNMSLFHPKNRTCILSKCGWWRQCLIWTFALQLPEGPVHVRQRSSPDALFPMMNGNNSSERGFSARDNVKKKSFDDTSAMPRGIHYSKTQKNALVNTYDLKQSLNCFLVLFQRVK